MDFIWQGFREALHMIASGDPTLKTVLGITLRVALFSTFWALVFGLPAGVLLGISTFRGRRPLLALANGGMGLPPVVVGLFVSILLWRSGPLGSLGLLYTPTAIVIAQSIIATPIIMGITIGAIQSLAPALRLQILALGATRRQLVWILVREARLPLMAAVMAGFGGVVSEVGASIMVGGNIKGYTRVLTTATVMETGRGEFDVAIALSVILLLASLGANYVLTVIQQHERPR